MSLQLFSLSKYDLEKAVEIVLKKAGNLRDNNVIVSREIKDNKLITQIEAAKFLQISLPTIIEWRKHKELPHYNFNGRYYYSKEELLNYGKSKNRK